MEQFVINKPVRLIELFSGIGSQAMAFKYLGVDFERYRSVELDSFSVKSYNAIHNTDFPVTDIRNVHGFDLGITDINNYCYFMTYTFPCQDLSLAGKQRGMSKGSGTRSGLLWEVERLLLECDVLPQVLFMENVPAVHSVKNMPNFNKWISFLESLGYKNYWQDMNARNYGVAQNRPRTFMVSLLGDYQYSFPEPVPLKYELKDYLEFKIPEKFYIRSDKSDEIIAKFMADRSAGFVLGDVDFCIGGLQAHQTIRTDGISPCLTAAMGMGGGQTPLVNHKDRMRKLMPLECWRLMGFNEMDFYKVQAVTSNSQLYKQIGNSIVRNVLVAVFGQMFYDKNNAYKYI